MPSAAAVLRHAQQCVDKAIVSKDKPKKAGELCSSAIRAVQDAGLHNSPDAAIRNEARSTLCLAYQHRADSIRDLRDVDLAAVLADSRTALEYAACADDAINAHLCRVCMLAAVRVMAASRRDEQTKRQCLDELPAACDALDAALQRPRERARLRFMRPVVPDVRQCAEVARSSRANLVGDRAAQLFKDGVALEHGSKFEEAVAVYTSAVESVRDADGKTKLKAGLLGARARALSILQRHDAALADAKAALQLDPYEPDLHFRLGNVHACAGDPRAACLAYMRGCIAHPARVPDFSQRMLPLNDVVKAFSDQELVQALPMVGCAVCKKGLDIQRCSRCRVAWYCCREHQRVDWPRHKLVCAELARIVDNESDTFTDQDLQLMMTTSPGPFAASVSIARLEDVSTWEAFSRRFPLGSPLSTWTTVRLKRMASYPLTLASALVALELHTRPSLCVHFVNMDDGNRCLFESSACVVKLLPFPEIHLVVSGLSALTTANALRPYANEGGVDGMSGRNAVKVSTKWALWHEAERELPPPDVVVGFNTDLQEVAYEWPATLRALAARNVPCVFTSPSEGEHERALAAVRAAGARLVFHGPAPFPSPRGEHMHGEMQYRNLFWLAFRGILGQGLGGSMRHAQTHGS